MNILEKIGLGRKSKGYSLTIKDSGNKDSSSTFFGSRTAKYLLISIFLIAVVVIYPRQYVEERNYKSGEVWTGDDLIAPFTFSLLKDKEEMDEERAQIVRNTYAIFNVDHNARIKIENQLDSVFSRIEPVLESYLQWRATEIDTNSPSPADSLIFIQKRNSSGVGIDSKAWFGLITPYLNAHLETYLQGNKTSRRSINSDIRLRIDRLVNDLFTDGIININKNEIKQNGISIRDRRARTERSQFLANVKDMPEAREFIRYQLGRALDESMAHTAIQIFNLIIEPNLIFSEEETTNRIQEAMNTISPTKGAVAKNQVIIRKGDLINSDRLNMLQSLAKAKADEASDLQIWKQYIGQIIIVFALLLVFMTYIYLYRKPIFDDNLMLILVFSLILLVIGANSFTTLFENISPYVVPMAVTPIMLTIVFDSRVGILSTIILAMITGLMNGYDFEFTTASLVACSMAVYSVRDIRNRNQFYLITPSLIFISYFMIQLGFTLTKQADFNGILSHIIAITINSLFNLVLIYPFILIIEKVFNLTTDVTLLELSDTNRPILKSLMLRATGTFHHSLQVANLAEAAAQAIGANALLCRVAALYHDIGKMNKPEYFSENQSGINVHEKLKPSMSALIIKQHVDKGVEMAYEEKLPEVIINFIRTHHGTSLIRYFYVKAQKMDNKNEVNPDDFCYNGPNPTSKEEGIMLLADSVEASSRSLPDPNYNKLENLIERIVDQKLDENQLVNCPLTFRDISKIKETFLTILVGVYHGRVQYPDDPKREKRQKPIDIYFGEYEQSKQQSSETVSDSNSPDDMKKNSEPNNNEINLSQEDKQTE